MTIAVAMSGGVDSSTVAALLSRRGEGGRVVGLTMQLWNQRRLAGYPGMPETVQGRCCSIDDVHDARRVAERLELPFYVVNYERRFEQDVVQPFVRDYLEGRTPIPCALCNTAVKFDELLRTARQIGADMLATGHYARIAHDPGGRFLLLRAADRSKDQSYFLFGLTQDQLSRSMFPLGELSKAEVRELARGFALPVAEKPDSHEICFVPGNDYKQFIEAYESSRAATVRERKEGELVDTKGRVLAHHTGVHNFTVGQRKGLGVAAGHPLYVLDIQPSTGRVTVGDDQELWGTEALVERVNWIAFDNPTEPLRAEVKIRYRHTPSPATVTPFDDGRARVVFESPQRAITPGQAAVFYRGDVVLGGGWIRALGARASRPLFTPA